MEKREQGKKKEVREGKGEEGIVGERKREDEMCCEGSEGKEIRKR